MIEATWWTVAIPALAGCLGAAIGGGASIWGAKLATQRDLELASTTAQRARLDTFEDRIISATTEVILKHESVYDRATMLRIGATRTKELTDRETELFELFIKSCTDALQAGQIARLATRSTTVHQFLDSARSEVNSLLQNARPGSNFDVHASRKRMIEVMDDITRAVRKEIDDARNSVS